MYSISYFQISISVCSCMIYFVYSCSYFLWILLILSPVLVTSIIFNFNCCSEYRFRRSRYNDAKFELCLMVCTCWSCKFSYSKRQCWRVFLIEKRIEEKKKILDLKLSAFIIPNQILVGNRYRIVEKEFELHVGYYFLFWISTYLSVRPVDT